MSIENVETIVRCERCNARCRVDGSGNPDAKMLRWSKGKGLCVNCAVHDWLRNTYPCNMLLAESGPRVLAYIHIREQFAEIMRVNCADANPDEINWNLVNENWDLPFADKVKPRSDNPITQAELDDIKAGKYKAIDTPPRGGESERARNPVFCRSIEDLNKAEPGLGDKLENLLTDKRSKDKEKNMTKKTKNSEEQLDLIEVGPENGKAIITEAKNYKKHQADRLAALKLELESKKKVLKLVKEANLQRLKDGVIRFTLDRVTFKVTPQDDLITIKEETQKKSKKGMKKRVAAEEKQFEESK